MRPLANIEVTFSEPVSGVNASNLLFNGAGATGITGAGAGPYAFTLAEPANGTLSVTWLGGHGILAVPPNSFAGGFWTYAVRSAASAPDELC